MKRILSFLLALSLGMSVLTAEEFTTGGVFVHSATKDLSYNSVSQTTTLTEKIAVGQTYRIDADIFEVATKEVETMTLEFSTDLLVKVNPETRFSVDAFNQLIINYEDPPSLLKAQYAITTLSLSSGEVEVIAPQVDENSQCVIQTPLANVLLAGGRYSIKSNAKYTIVNVIEGKATIMGLDEKKSDIVKGQMGLVIPFPGKNDGIMVTSKGISPTELVELVKATDTLQLLQKNVVFAIIDKKVVGVRIK